MMILYGPIELIGNLIITKQDYDTENSLSGMKFKVQNSKKGTKGWIKQSSSGEISYVAESDATEFTTDSNGKIEIDNIIVGSYSIKETSTNTYGYTKLVSNTSATINAGDNSVTIKNEKQTGDLIIHKRDADSTSTGLAGRKFKLKASDGKYVKVNDKETVTGSVTVTGMTTTEKDNATTFISDSSGNLVINDIMIGKYTIEEQDAGFYGYTVLANTSKEVERHKDNEITIKNEKKTGNIVISKKDKNTDKGIEGIVFRIKNTELGYINVGEKITGSAQVTGYSQYTSDVNKATQFITDSSGTIKVGNVLTYYNEKDVSKYVIEEVDVGSNWVYAKEGNGNSSVDSNYVEWKVNTTTTAGTTATINVSRQKSTNTASASFSASYATSVEYKNKQKYTNISGYVWIDKKEEKKAANSGDDVYTSVDTWKANVPVRLKDKSGNIIKETKTNSKGAYLFENVLVSSGISSTGKLTDNYYVEFEYNGITYTTVAFKNQDNGSKVKENSTTRANFNTAYNTLEVSDVAKNTGKFTNATGKSGQIVQYSQKNNKSTNTVLTNTTDYNIQATTKDASYKIPFDWGLETVENINCGLYERNQPDMSLLEDTQNVRVNVNGYEHLYEYANRYKSVDTDKVDFYSESTVNAMETSFKNADGSYTGWIREADVITQTGGKDLEAYITYRVKAINSSGSNIYTQVNSINNFYDSRLTIDKIGTGIDSEGKITGSLSYTDKGTNNGYKVVNINTSTLGKIEMGKAVNIYISFKIDRDVLKTMLTNENFEIQDNITEIASYSSYYKNDSTIKDYAGIDQDSAPGNVKPGDKTTYEDDTGRAEAFKIKKGESRNIVGAVFEDNKGLSNTIQTNKERKGNGIYDSGEHGIGGVEITYKSENVTYKTTTISEAGKYVAKQYVQEGTGETLLETYLKNNSYNIPKNSTIIVKLEKNNSGTQYSIGDYYIPSFAAGEYTMSYEWGGQTYGDTTYTVQDYKGTTQPQTEWNRKAGNTVWYRDNVSTRYTDAQDNWTTREEIDAEIANENARNTDAAGNLIAIDYSRTMVATTNKMNCTIENKSGTKTEASSLKTKGEDYSISNVDYGIIERPRQDISIEKYISHITLKLANGQIIIDADVKDGDLDGLRTGAAYTSPSGTNNGLLKIEIDDELLQGSTLVVKYTIEVKNNSEIDYQDENYYHYGSGQDANKIVKIKPVKVYDYLDKEYGIDEAENDWKEVDSASEYKNNSYVTMYEWRRDNVKYSADTKKYTWEKSGGTTSGTYTDYYNYVKSQRTESELNRILKEDSKTLEAELAPEEKNTKDMVVSKTLSTSDEIELDNKIELTKATRNWGHTYSNDKKNWYDAGETIIVTDPQGADMYSIVIYSSLAVISLAILGLGIVLIQKIVLKKKK